MCQNTTLRMMERENLSSFKSLTQAKNRKIMNIVIKDYCNSDLDMCSYTTLWMMYQGNVKASQQTLSW
ncbi:MAG: hypothetical protein ACI9CD_000741 [Candidatus Deianiraeaceae bacterium]|jgi:hypothetical protein